MAMFSKIAQLKFGFGSVRWDVILALLLAAALHAAPKSSEKWFEEKFSEMPGYAQAACFGALFGIIAATASSGPQPFVYYHFNAEIYPPAGPLPSSTVGWIWLSGPGEAVPADAP